MQGLELLKNKIDGCHAVSVTELGKKVSDAGEIFPVVPSRSRFLDYSRSSNHIAESMHGNDRASPFYSGALALKRSQTKLTLCLLDVPNCTYYSQKASMFKVAQARQTRRRNRHRAKQSLALEFVSAERYDEENDQKLSGYARWASLASLTSLLIVFTFFSAALFFLVQSLFMRQAQQASIPTRGLADTSHMLDAVLFLFRA